MRGLDLIRSAALYTRYWARARCLELAMVLVCGLAAVVLWEQDLPTRSLRPDLAPEQMVQLLAALLGCCTAVALRRETGAMERLASAAMAGRRMGWLAFGLTVVVLSAGAAAWTMPSDIGGQYVRNVAAYVGVVLILGAISGVAAMAAPWLWFALSVTIGQASDRGVAQPAWWAYPLQDAGWHPEVAVVLLGLGAAAWTLRR